jgi:hypothetical protein
MTTHPVRKTHKPLQSEKPVIDQASTKDHQNIVCVCAQNRSYKHVICKVVSLNLGTCGQVTVSWAIVVKPVHSPERMSYSFYYPSPFYRGGCGCEMKSS